MSAPDAEDAARRAEALVEALDALSPESREQMTKFTVGRMTDIRMRHGEAFYSAVVLLLFMETAEETLHRLGFMLPFKSSELLAHLVRISILETKQWVGAIEETKSLMASAVMFVDDPTVLSKAPPPAV